MSDYGSSLGMPLDPYDDPRSTAKRKLFIPAIALIFIGVISVLYAIGTSLMSGQYKESVRQQMRQIEQNQDLSPGMKTNFKKVLSAYQDFMPAFHGIAAICGAVIAIGGYQMLTLSARWMCYLATIFSMLSIVNCCCCIGIIFGVWAIIMLNMPDVRNGFAFQSHLANQK